MASPGSAEPPPESDVGPLTLDELIDESLMDTFPASDPPSFWGRESPREKTHADDPETPPDTR